MPFSLICSIAPFLYSQNTEGVFYISCFYYSSLIQSYLHGSHIFLWVPVTVMSFSSVRFLLTSSYMSFLQGSLQFSSVMSDSLWPQALITPGFPVHHQLHDLAQTHVHQVGDAIQPSHSLSSPSPPASVFPRLRVFSSESVLSIRWPKFWSFSFSLSPSNKYSGLIAFMIDITVGYF